MLLQFVALVLIYRTGHRAPAVALLGSHYFLWGFICAIEKALPLPPRGDK